MSYRDNKAISQSLLKTLFIDPSFFTKQEEKSSEALTTGSLVDVLLLTPHKVKEEFYIFPNLQPNENVLKIILELYKLCHDFPFINLKEQVIHIAREQHYRDKHSNEVILKNAWTKEAQEYYKHLQKAGNKTIIDSKKYEQCKLVVKTIKANRFYKLHIKNSKLEHCEQCEIYWEWRGIKLKSLLDKMLIDHKKKIVYPYDLKTTGDLTSMFGKPGTSFWKYRYDVQAVFYMSAAQYHYPDYTIMPFRFLVANVNNNSRIRIFEMSPERLELALNGGIYKGREYEGLNLLMDRYIWHNTNNIWNLTREEHENKGITILTG